MAREVLGEVADAPLELREQGKIRFCGMTVVRKTSAPHRVIDWGALQIVQAVYDLVNPGAGADVS